MSNIWLIKQALQAKNLKLAELLLKKSDLKEMFGPTLYHQRTLDDLGIFENSEAFNFLIDFFYRNRKQGIIKEFFSNSKKLPSASGFLNKKNYQRVRKITRKNWWILGDCDCLKEAIRKDNYFMTEVLLDLAKSYNVSLSYMIGNGNFNHSLRGSFEESFKCGGDFQVLKLIAKHAENLPQTLINLVFDSGNYENNKLAKIQKIIKVFRLKGVRYSEHQMLQTLNDKEFFFFFYKNIKTEQKSSLSHLSYYSKLLSILSNRIEREIDKDVMKFLLKQNLKAIA